MRIAVWAPFAERVELVLTGLDVRLPMVRREQGEFDLDDERLADGVDYGFSLDGGSTLPDPRSRSQPKGVHGPSRFVDTAQFRWTDVAFAPTPFEQAVIYELHIGSFSQAGTFDGAIERLSHLVELGVTHVEIMPVAAFPGEHGWGYDGVYPFAVHESYGGTPAFQRFVDACHALGIAVLLDVVYNHLGPSGCYVARYGPYFTGKYRTPWGEALSYDGARSDPVRRFVCDNALYWLEHFHLDGLRLDAVQEIFDASPLHILEQLQDEVERLSRRLEKPLVLVAETPANDPRLLRPRSLGGYGLRAQWNDDFHHATRAVLTSDRAGYLADYGSLAKLARAFTEGYVYQGEFSQYRGRAHGRTPDHVELTQFVNFAQNHDQVGNRPAGDRLGHRVGLEKSKQAAALVLLSPGVPLLFMGEEWGATSAFPYFTAHAEPELAAAVRNGRIREAEEFGWPPQAVPDPQSSSTFQSSKLHWDEIRKGAHAELLGWYQALSKLRARALTGSDWPTRDVAVRYDEKASWFAARVRGVSVVLNFGTEPRTLEVPTLDLGGVGSLAGARQILVSSERIAVSGEAVSLPADSTLIWWC
jgi:maltooligosyltrehalose trehalohydrolase